MLGLRQWAEEFTKQGAEESWHTPRSLLQSCCWKRSARSACRHARSHVHTHKHKRHRPLPVMQSHGHGRAPPGWHIPYAQVEWVAREPWPLLALRAIVAHNFMHSFFFFLFFYLSPLSLVVKIYQQMLYSSACQHLWAQSAPLMQAQKPLGRLLLASQGKRRENGGRCPVASISSRRFSILWKL